MGALIGRNTRVEVSKTLATAIAVSAITQASPGVVTFSGTPPANGDIMVMSMNVGGMTRLRGQAARVASLAGSPTNTFALERVDTSLSTYAALDGATTAQKVSAWATLGTARSVEAGTPGANRIDSSALIDPVKNYLMGQPDTPEINVGVISDPLLEAAGVIEEAAEEASLLVFRLTLQDGSKRVFSGFVTAPSESIPLGDLITGGFAIVQVGRRIAYAS